MKKLFTILLLSFTFSCSQKSEELAPTLTLQDGFDKDGINETKPSVEFDIIQYQTKLDTTFIVPNIGVTWGMFIQEGDSLSALWTVTPNVSYTKGFVKQWDQQRQKWSALHYINIDKSSPSGVVSVLLKKHSTGESFTRQQNITINHVVKKFDLLRVNFGMIKSEVKSNEIDRLYPNRNPSIGWNEETPNFAFLSNLKITTKQTGYEFEGDKLKFVHFFDYSPSDKNADYMPKYDRDYMISLAKQNEAKTPIFEEKTIEGSLKYKTADKVTWSKNGMKMTYGLRKLQITSTPKEIYTLTYEKTN